jgi:alpha-1,4-digalacturonate transport system permease protein
MRGLQRMLGVPRIGWMFVAPNLISSAVHVPADRHRFLLRVHGGVAALSAQRPYRRRGELETLFECENYLDPSTCRKDLFWRAIYNTASFACCRWPDGLLRS